MSHEELPPKATKAFEAIKNRLSKDKIVRKALGNPWNVHNTLDVLVKGSTIARSERTISREQYVSVSQLIDDVVLLVGTHGHDYTYEGGDLYTNFGAEISEEEAMERMYFNTREEDEERTFWTDPLPIASDPDSARLFCKHGTGKESVTMWVYHDSTFQMEVDFTDHEVDDRNVANTYRTPAGRMPLPEMTEEEYAVATDLLSSSKEAIQNLRQS